jgi:uncharacterized membrane protein YhhN
MKTKVLSIIYFLTGFLFIFLQCHSFVISGFITKALIIPPLIFLFLINIRPALYSLHSLVLAGLIFSWAGDIALEVPLNNGNMFITGLVCFLLAHIMYLTLFFRTPGNNIIFKQRIYLLIPILIYGFALGYYLFNDLGGMRIPVIIYTIVILTMLAGAVNRLEKVNRVSYLLVLAGAIMFVISDSAIAVNKFSNHFKSSEIVIMSTYILAQYLIIIGYIKQFRETYD